MSCRTVVVRQSLLMAGSAMLESVRYMACSLVQPGAATVLLSVTQRAEVTTAALRRELSISHNMLYNLNIGQSAARAGSGATVLQCCSGRGSLGH